MSNASSKLVFLWHRQRGILLASIIAVVVTAMYVRPWSSQPQVEWWQPLDAIFGVATLAVALLVWFGELKESWEGNLPKRLRVVYLYKREPVMVCEDCVLIAETDIRGMAQQMGAQINGGRNLELGPIFDMLTPRIENVAGVGPVRRYEIRMTLNSLPQRVEETRAKTGSPQAVLVRRITGDEVSDVPVDNYKLATDAIRR